MMKPTHARPLDQAKVHEAQPRKRSPENSNSHGMETSTTADVMQTSLWCFAFSFLFYGSGCVSSLSRGRYARVSSFQYSFATLKVLFVCWPILLGSTYCILVYSFCDLLWPKSPRSGSKGPTLQRSGPQQILLITLVPVASPPWRFSLCGRRTWKKWEGWVGGLVEKPWRGCDHSFLIWEGAGCKTGEVLMCFAHFLVVIKL